MFVITSMEKLKKQKVGITWEKNTPQLNYHQVDYSHTALAGTWAVRPDVPVEGDAVVNTERCQHDIL